MRRACRDEPSQPTSLHSNRTHGEKSEALAWKDIGFLLSQTHLYSHLNLIYIQISSESKFPVIKSATLKMRGDRTS